MEPLTSIERVRIAREVLEEQKEASEVLDVDIEHIDHVLSMLE